METEERVWRALNFEETDRVPIFEDVRSRPLIEKVSGLNFWDDPIKAHIKTLKTLGIDMTIGVGIPARERCEYRNEMGFVYVRDEYASFVKERPYKSVEDVIEWIRSLPPPLSEEEIAEGFKRYVTPRRKALLPGCVFIGHGGGCWPSINDLGASYWSMLLYRYPNEFVRLMDHMTENSVRTTKVYTEVVGGLAFLVPDDIADKNGLNAKPEFFRKFYIPRLKKILQPLKKRGVKALFHTDGNVDPILDNLVNQAGIEGWFGMEPRAGNDLASLKEKYGDKIVLIGNIDTGEVLQLGTPERVKETVIQSIRAAAPGSGYFLSSENEIHWAIPPENAITMYKTAHKYGRYPFRP